MQSRSTRCRFLDDTNVEDDRGDTLIDGGDLPLQFGVPSQREFSHQELPYDLGAFHGAGFYANYFGRRRNAALASKKTLVYRSAPHGPHTDAGSLVAPLRLLSTNTKTPDCSAIPRPAERQDCDAGPCWSPQFAGWQFNNYFGSYQQGPYHHRRFVPAAFAPQPGGGYGWTSRRRRHAVDSKEEGVNSAVDDNTVDGNIVSA